MKMTRRGTAVATMLMIITVSHGGSDSEMTGQTNEENTCTLYLAESSMKNVNGNGLFTVKHFKKGETILEYDAPTIPVLGPWRGDHVLDHYWWGEGRGTSHECSFETDDYICDYGVTFATLPNYHTYLMNLRTRIPHLPYDDTFIETTGNAGAGAFSYHEGRAGVAWKDIGAGDEIFLDYGLERREDSDYFEWFEHVPIMADYKDAGNIMLNNWEYLEDLRHDSQDPELKVLGHVLRAIYDTAAATNERVASILPKNASDYDRVAKRVLLATRREFSEALAREMSLQQRSVEWIKENGRCVDHIVPGRSKLPHAGRGAIAQRFIASGDVVVPVPLLQILNRDRLAMWGGINNDEQVGTQLLLNYCFGHEESSLLLCPITNAILINHCSNRTKECGESGPNAEFRWDTTWDRDTKRWLNMTLDEIAKQSGRGLAFEVVATRDIQPGEEIFMDYGSAWENAWNQHVAKWDHWNKDGEMALPSVTKLNEDTGPVRIMSGDLRKLADHPAFQTGCVYWEDNDDWEDFDDDLSFLDNDDWHDWSDEDILYELGRDGSHFIPEDSRDLHSGGMYWSCSVIREENDGSYIVQVFPSSKLHGKPWWYKENVPRFLTSYPRGSIRYFTKPYKSDVHFTYAFRHYITISDDIFPTHWKDRKENIEDDGEIDEEKKEL